MGNKFQRGWKFATNATTLRVYVQTTSRLRLVLIINDIQSCTEIIRRAGKPIANMAIFMMMGIPIGKSVNILASKHVIARCVIKDGTKNVANVGERKRENSPKS